MDSDEFDDDILDEDLIIAATESVKHPPNPHDYRHHSAGRRPGAPSNNGYQTTLYGAASQGRGSGFSRTPSFGSFSGLQGQPLGGPAPTFRQTTLFGGSVQNDEVDSVSSQPNRNRVFRVDMPPEAPTHHEIDREAMQTWVYPTNLGAIRDYQFSIVKNGLFNNTLVALPTGLGKTFIAATIMLNFFRWTKHGKIIFVAPTKPLVSQQVDACFNIVGIPRSETTLLTGEVSPGLRVDEWQTKRVFFMTPQTLENDLSAGYADPKSIVLLVVDEAHRATGNYAYVRVVSFLRRFSKSFRVLALTATPGSKVEAVQEVIDNLGISHVEIRTEESLDIRQYVHSREEDIIALDPSDEMVQIKDLFSKALKPLVDKLSQQNIYYGRDPMSLTTFGLLQARKDWMARVGHHANQGLKFMMNAVFTVLQGLAHAIKLLNFHGIKPFYDSLVQFRDETEGKGQKGSKTKRQIIDSPSFQEMMKTIAAWASKDNFISHPKLTYLADTVLNHFMDAGEGREGGSSSNTRIIVFSEYRDSAEEIVRVLNTHKPLIRAAVFVGQADSKRSEGMRQAEQIERIKKFKEGVFNVLVATSIGEEGLDIGQVDLIICFDASASPIRMLQRMGRTGRKRAGRVVLLLMRGKEEDNYAKSKDGYEKMQEMICEGSRFAFRHDLSTRIVPREIKPEVDKRHVDIPIENTQNHSLPEPKKGKPRKKKPPKKFHMPDDVETGFASVASLLGKKTTKKTAVSSSGPVEEDEITRIPELNQVLLNSVQTEQLSRAYTSLPMSHSVVEDIQLPQLTTHPIAQRALQKTAHVKHGLYTKRCVKLFKTLAKSQSSMDRYYKPYGDADSSRYHDIPLPSLVSDSDDLSDTRPPRKRQRTQSPTDDEDEPRAREKSQPKKALSGKRQGQVSFVRTAEIDMELDEEEDRQERLSIPSRHSTTSKKKAPPQTAPRKRGRPPKNPKPVLVLDEGTGEEDAEEEDDDDLERRTAPRGRKPALKTKPAPPKAAPRKRGRPPKNRNSGVYDESADEGDDCGRTSDLERSDDSDSGADLVDFIVGSEMASSSQQRRSPSLSSASAASTPRARGRRRRPTELASSGTTAYSGPTQVLSTQDSDSDDDMPSMSQILEKKSRSAPATSSIRTQGEDEEEDDDDEEEEEEEEEENFPRRSVIARRPNKRRAVFDDDDDDDDDSDE